VVGIKGLTEQVWRRREFSNSRAKKQTPLLHWRDDDGSPERALTEAEYKARLQHMYDKPYHVARHNRHGRYARRRVLAEREHEIKREREAAEERRYEERYGGGPGWC